MYRMVSIVLLSASLLSGQTAQEIVRRAVQLDDANYERARAYSYLHRIEERKLNESGQVQTQESKTYRTILVAGDPYSELIQRNDRPLTAAELDREREKLAKETNERQSSPEAARKSREKRRRFMRDLPEAFNFTLIGNEVINGRPVYVIAAEPRPGYHPTDSLAGRVFPNVRGKLWIDKQDYQWVRSEAEVISPITFGLFIARLAPGATVHAEQERVNNEVWMPHQVNLKFDARVALVKHVNQEMVVTFKDFKKSEVETELRTKRTKAAQN